MNPRALVGRVAAMDADELRFRAACGLRKAAGRARFALSRPAWRRGDLARLLDPDAGPLVREARDAAARRDHLAAHRALARHFATRPARWPIAAARRDALTTLVRDRFPGAAAAATARANGVLEGRYDLLGYRQLALGNPPDWHVDAVHARRAPAGFWSAIRFLDPVSGDHKVIWEINRHQHFLALGTAFWLSGDTRYRDAFVAHLQDWLRANPPLAGINWASMLELAFRALSWTWAVEFFATGGGVDTVPWLVDLLVALDRQLEHVEHNLSTYFSPNTHISGEALALYAVSRAFPELRRSAGRGAIGRALLQREARLQLKGDGGHAELSSHYHRYSTDFYLLAQLVAMHTADGTPFAEPVRAQARYLRTIADDCGRLPHIGDEDGGQLFRFGSAASADASATLAAAASLLEDASLAVAPPTVDVYWILGGEPRVTIPRAAAAWPSRVLADSGYVVLRRRDPDGYLLFDAGAHGFLNGGHAHADALSVLVTIAREPLFVDAGTPTYTMDAAARDRFRAPSMHNTLTIDGEPFARPRGPFHWQARADARLLAAQASESAGFAAGMHAGYGFPLVRLVATVGDQGWLILDYAALPRPARVDASWHLHPSWSAARAPSGFALTHASGLRTALATTASQGEIADDAWSPDYGRIEPATSLRTFEHAFGPVVIGSYVPFRIEGGRLPAIFLTDSSVDAQGWVRYAFLIDDAQETRVTVALPRDLHTEPRVHDWPQPCIQERRAVCVE